MKKYKVEIGEWVYVYKTDVAIITTDKDIENMSASQIATLIDNDDKTTIESCDKYDYDWSTESHKEWDTNEDGIKVLEQMD